MVVAASMYRVPVPEMVRSAEIVMAPLLCQDPLTTNAPVVLSARVLSITRLPATSTVRSPPMARETFGPKVRSQFDATMRSSPVFPVARVMVTGPAAVNEYAMVMPVVETMICWRVVTGTFVMSRFAPLWSKTATSPDPGMPLLQLEATCQSLSVDPVHVVVTAKEDIPVAIIRIAISVKRV